jgi:hypothetical protein
MPVKASDIVRTARAYVGMAFRHQGRGRPSTGGKIFLSATIDCAGLLVCVGEDLGLKDVSGNPILRSDHMDIGPQPHQDIIHTGCQMRLIQRPKGEMPRAGDVVTLRAPNSISHCGIISNFPQGDGLGLIFPYPVRLKNALQGQIVEVRLDERWRSRIAGVLHYPGVEE